MQETWVGSLGRKDRLEKGKATHFSILAWRIPWMVTKLCVTLATSWTVAGQPPLRTGFSRQEDWSGLPLPTTTTTITSLLLLLLLVLLLF